jgi:hypothetical protein
MAPIEKQLANLAVARARALEVRAAFASSTKEEKADILRARAEKLVTKRVKKIASPVVEPTVEVNQLVAELTEDNSQPVDTPQSTAPEPTAPDPTIPEPADIPKKEKAAVMRDGKRRRRIIILDSSSDDEGQPTSPPTRQPVADDLGLYRRLGLF